jgi:hypothetical protein
LIIIPSAITNHPNLHGQATLFAQQPTILTPSDFSDFSLVTKIPKLAAHRMQRRPAQSLHKGAAARTGTYILFPNICQSFLIKVPGLAFEHLLLMLRKTNFLTHKPFCLKKWLK